jgi:Trypsin-like peptidase domain
LTGSFAKERVLYRDERLGGVPRFGACSRLETRVLIPDEVRKCVAFIGAEVKGVTGWVGTGFFVSRPWKTIPEARFVYLVTARHVINHLAHKKATEVLVRLDNHDGKAGVWRTKASDWKEHPGSSVDLCVYKCPDEMAPLYPIMHIPLPLMAATEENLAKHIIALGVGDALFLTGLFENRIGDERNIPIIRVGTLSAMREEEIRWDKQLIDAYLVETHSIGGHSGSPVFVHYGSAMPQRTPGSGTLGIGVSFYLLGVLRGHYDDKKKAINQGIAVVTPVEKVIEALDVFDEEDAAEEALENARVAASQVEDSAN